MQAVITKAKGQEKFICTFFDSNALSVLITARDLIHNGWILLNHPLYGNFRPHQQPYRSLLLKTSGSQVVAPDLPSITFIEEALLVYSSNPLLSPKEAPVALTDDYGALDCELMRLPLEQAGIISSGYEFFKKKH